MFNFTITHLEGTLQPHSKFVFDSKLILGLAEGDGTTMAPHHNIMTSLKKGTHLAFGKVFAFFLS